MDEKNNWRLPTLDELETLINSEKIFTGVFWSSTEAEKNNNSEYMWLMDLTNNSPCYSNIENKHKIIRVRLKDDDNLYWDNPFNKTFTWEEANMITSELYLQLMALKKRGILYALTNYRSEIKKCISGEITEESTGINEPLLSELIEILDNNEEDVIDTTITFINEESK